MSENQKRILVVDDEDDICQIIKEKFTRLGYEVIVAHDGGEGLLKTVEEKPDCVLLDVRISGGDDGLTYLRNLRGYRHEDMAEQERIRKTRVMMLTGAGSQMQSLFDQEGISAYIEKPFDLTNLQKKIEELLSK